MRNSIENSLKSLITSKYPKTQMDVFRYSVFYRLVGTNKGKRLPLTRLAISTSHVVSPLASKIKNARLAASLAHTHYKVAGVYPL